MLPENLKESMRMIFTEVEAIISIRKIVKACDK
jgi:hypothetical protein